jgi:hypothetical protein
MAVEYNHEFLELHNHRTNHSIIVREFSDLYFDHGYRFKRWVPSNEVDLFEIDENEERLSLWIMKNSPSDPYIYTRDVWNTIGTSEGYFYEEPEIY